MRYLEFTGILKLNSNHNNCLEIRSTKGFLKEEYSVTDIVFKYQSVVTITGRPILCQFHGCFVTLQTVQALFACTGVDVPFVFLLPSSSALI